MNANPTVLITGSNRGIGLELVRQYATSGWRVIATCRNPVSVGELASLPGKIEIHGLEVDDFAQVDGLARELKSTPVDVLINNAGVYGPKKYAVEEVDSLAWAEVLRVNVMAPLRVSTAFASHVAASQQRKIVCVTSKMGSMGDNGSGGAYIYRSSKAAVNAVMRSLARDFRDRGIVVALLHPGWVQTDMGGSDALISVAESVTGMRRVIEKLDPARSGTFMDYQGSAVPW